MRNGSPAGKKPSAGRVIGRKVSESRTENKLEETEYENTDF